MSVLYSKLLGLNTLKLTDPSERKGAIATISAKKLKECREWGVGEMDFSPMPNP